MLIRLVFLKKKLRQIISLQSQTRIKISLVLVFLSCFSGEEGTFISGICIFIFTTVLWHTTSIHMVVAQITKRKKIVDNPDRTLLPGLFIHMSYCFIILSHFISERSLVHIFPAAAESYEFAQKNTRAPQHPHSFRLLPSACCHSERIPIIFPFHDWNNRVISCFAAFLPRIIREQYTSFFLQCCTRAKTCQIRTFGVCTNARNMQIIRSFSSFCFPR